MARNHEPLIPGLSVPVKYDNVEQALRKLKKKVQESGKIRESKMRESYEKPTTVRKRKQNLARRRWQKKLAKETLARRPF